MQDHPPPNDDGGRGRPTPGLSLRLVIVFYVILAVIAWGLSLFFEGLDPFVWHDENHTSLWFDAGISVGFGLLVVALSQVLDQTTEWAEELGREFGKILGKLEVEQIFVIACASGIGEELFFRGFLQQVLTEFAIGGPNAVWWGLGISSLVFGLLHVGPDFKKFLPWTLMAIVFGGAFGWIFLYTGNLLGPILAHFTINFFNIMSISEKYGVSRESDG